MDGRNHDLKMDDFNNEKMPIKYIEPLYMYNLISVNALLKELTT
jgi:hypothetical protein